MMYFDGRETDISDEEMHRVRTDFDPDGSGQFCTGVEMETEQLYGAHSTKLQEKVSYHVDIQPSCLYPRPPTVDMAREMYLNDELTESEFESTVETALRINGIDWGEWGA